MPVLANPKHERFAQELAKGKSQTEAYEMAGYKGDRTAASRLSTNVNVQARVQELQERGAARAEITVAKVLGELAKIGFSDIRKAVSWRANVTGMVEEDDGGQRLAVTNEVALIDSDKIDDDTAACIAEVSQNAQGGLKVKLHDKRAALVDIGRHLGMFTDRAEVTLTDKRAEEMSEEELLAIAAGGRRGAT